MTNDAVFRKRKSQRPIFFVALCTMTAFLTACTAMREQYVESGRKRFGPTPLCNNEIAENGGFEKESPLPNMPAGWHKTVLPKYEHDVDFIWDDTTSYNGKKSISISISDSYPDEQQVHYNWYTELCNMHEEHHYELTCRVKCKNVKETAWICIQCWDESNSRMMAFATTEEKYRIAGTSDWRKVKTTFTAPKGTQTVTVRAGISAPGNKGCQVWFDDLCIYEVSGLARIFHQVETIG